MIIDKRDTKNLGQVFTPDFIINKILDEVGYIDYKILGKKILEPSCGNGAFLEEIVNRIIQFSPTEDLQKNLECVYGWELDTDVYNECIERLNNIVLPLGLKISWNIENTNSIFKKEIETRFDYIVGNPPYLLCKKLDKQTQDYIARNYIVCTGNYDIYFAFFELCYTLLTTEGKASLITPTTYFYGDSANSLREFLYKKQSIIKISDYNDIMVFYPVSTFTSITVFNKLKNSEIVFENITSEYHKHIDVTIDTTLINISKLSENRWNFKSDVKYVKVNNPIRKYCKVTSAINTGADSVTILKFIKLIDRDIMEVENKNNESFLIERKFLKKIVKISREKNVQGSKIEYCIFPYFISENLFHVYTEEYIIENFPLAYEYLLKNKSILEPREFEKWYSLTLNTNSIKAMLGEKIIFSPLMLTPKFIHRDDNLLYYSGFLLKFNKMYKNQLLNSLNSIENWERVSATFNVVKGGWKRIRTSVLLDEISLD